ncbi:hypothetical protein R3P38DRAFT_3359257 [Favolaschia claudopus]|uniref:Uncharacterized protein n=1 Tax=Favolaschia claudopus TaxID=2862362 RepID=A0AAW0B004_9AGAR
MRDLSLDDLAECNNRGCEFGCGLFELPDDFQPVARAPSTTGVRMFRPRVQTMDPQAPNPVPTPNPIPSQAQPPQAGVFSSASNPIPQSTFTSIPHTTQSTFGSGYSAGSATANTMFNSRPEASTRSSHAGLQGSTAAPSAFRNLAGSRTRDISAAMGGIASGSGLSQAANRPSDGAKKIFHPALKAQLEADLTRDKNRKRKRRASPSPARNIRPKLAKILNYCMLFIPMNKDVNRGICSVPSAYSLRLFEERQYVQEIMFTSDDSVHDIETKIQIAYSHLPEIKQYGFRLLATTRKMRMDRNKNLTPIPGIPRILRTLKREVYDVTALKIALRDSNIRQSGPRYKKIVFIALKPNGPNLPLRGVTYDTDDDLDHDLPTEYSEDSDSDESGGSDAGNSDADITMDEADANEDEDMVSGTPTNFKDKGKGREVPPVDSRFDTGFFDDDVAAGVEYDSEVDRGVPHPAPETSTSTSVKSGAAVVPEAHLRMVRLLRNMEQPDPKNGTPVAYWASAGRGVGCFVLGNKSAELCAGILAQFVVSPETSVLSPAQVLSFVEANICQPFAMLTNFGKRLIGYTESAADDEIEAEFDRAFVIGAGGLHGLAPHLLSAYMALPVALKAGASHDTFSAHLRFKHDRSQWDPRGGCRELAVILHSKDNDLPVATEEDFLHLNLGLLLDALDKETPNVGEIHFLLMDALGDASNPREMTATRVFKGGEYGMRRFYTLVVIRVLDELDTAHPDYPALLATVQSASLGVARKIRNFFKGGGIAGANTTSDAGPSASRPNTRSRTTKRTTGRFDTDFDDMTNTDSLASGWEHDLSDGEPDVLVRRAKRRKTQPPPSKPKPSFPKSPPIIISSDSSSSSGSDSSSDGTFKRAYAQWTGQAHRKQSQASSSNQRAPPASTSQPGFSSSARPSTTEAPPPPQASTSTSASVSASQTRARPVWLDSTALEADDVQDAQTLLRRSPTRYWQGVMREIIERFPHPDPSRRLTMQALLAPGMTRMRQYHMLSLAYHVDRNVSGTPHWLHIASILSQIINDTRKYKLDDPRIVPLGSRFQTSMN